MAKPDEAPGQQKTHVITNPATGETKTVTQEEWREGKYGQQGWVKTEDAGAVEPEPPA